MNVLKKIFLAASVFTLHNLLAEPHWTSPFALYSTPDTPNGIAFPSVLGTDNAGNALVLYLTPDETVAFGDSAMVSAEGLVAYSLKPSHLSGYSRGALQISNLSVSQAVNNNGDALLAYSAWNNGVSRASLQASKFTANTAEWTNPAVLSNVLNSNHSIYGAPQVYLHADGTGVAVWNEGTSMRYNLFNGTSWLYNGASSATDINDNYSVALGVGDPSLILLDYPLGNNTTNVSSFVGYSDSVTTYSFGGGTSAHFIHIYSAGSDFSWANNLSNLHHRSEAPSNAGLKTGVMNSNGNFAVVWVDYASANIIAYSNSAASESIAYAFSQGETLTGMALAYDLDNIATLLITTRTVQDNVTSYAVKAVRGNLGGVPGAGASPSWTGFTLFQISDNQLTNPLLGSDNNGNVFAVWKSDDAQSNGAIYFNYWDNDQEDWFYTYPLQLSPYGCSATSPSLAVNNNGNAFIAWIKNGVTVEAVQTTQNTYNNQTAWFKCLNNNMLG